MDKLINILYISYDGMTDPLGQSQVLPYINGLSKKGYKFTLISCEKGKRFAQNKEKIEALCKSANIDWYPITYTKSPPVFSTIYDVIRIRRLAFHLHQDYQFKMVHCRSYLPALVGLALKTKYDIRFLFDMRGFWADERIDGELWNLENPIYKRIYKYFKNKEVQFLEKADGIVSLTNNGEREMRMWKQINKPNLPITVIPCCVDLAHFDLAKINDNYKEQLRNELNISKDDFVLTYLGSIGTWYMLKEMLEFFKFLLKYKPNAKFLFITGEPKLYIQEEALKMNIPGDQIRIRYGQREEVPTLLSLGSFSIFFIKPVYSKKSSSPTKQGEIMAMGIPAICNSGVGDTDEIIERYQSGYLLKDFSQKEMERVIRLLIKEKKFDEHTIREGAKAYFSLTNGIEEYYKIYKSLIVV